jgi:hypothetical protein
MPAPSAHDDTFETRIERGMRLLDELEPGWRERVDLGRLDMSSCLTCILGQLYGDYTQGLSELGVWDAEAYGFDTYGPDPTTSQRYQELTAAWQEALRPAGEEPATADPAVVSPTDEGVGLDV